MIRQAHPGRGVESYDHFEEKFDDAEKYVAESGIAWPVLVDDVAGSTHQVYGGLADPVYLIDVDGRIAFYNMWAHAPTLHRAFKQLVFQRGHGVIGSGIDRTPHVLASLTDGWRGIQRGLPQSLIDLETALPASGLLLWLGYQLKPLLAPITLRAKPLPRDVRIGLALGGAALAAGFVWALYRARHRNGREAADLPVAVPATPR